MNLQQTRCAEAELKPGDVPDWVQLLPAGLIQGRDGRTFRLSDGTAVIAASQAGETDLPIDYEHQADDDAQQKNGPVPAAGWIKALELRKDGIWGRVEWTDTARQMVAAREYRYLSPVILHSRSDGTIMRLMGASVVHRPNLTLKALSSEEVAMPESPSPLASIAAALGLAPVASAAEIVTAINAIQAPDPEKYVPVSAVLALLKERNEHTVTIGQKDANTRVEAALASGYITPAMREWAMALCSRNPDSFDAFLASATPAYAHLFHRRKWPRSPERRGAVSAEATAICDQLGIDPVALR